MASPDVDAAIRLLLHRTAHLHYTRQSPTEKSSIRQTFMAMDESRDGRISLREFLQKSTKEDEDQASSSYSQIRIIPQLFHFLDSDRSGFLEFDEFITLHYLMYSGLQLCDSCQKPIIMIGYTCRTCWLDRTIREDENEEDEEHQHRYDGDDTYGNGNGHNVDFGDVFD